MTIVRLGCVLVVQIAAFGVLIPSSRADCTGSAGCIVVRNFGTGPGVDSIAGSGSAIISTSDTGRGLLSYSIQNDGIDTRAIAANKSAVYAHHDGNASGVGVFAITVAGVGVVGVSNSGDGMQAGTSSPTSSAVYARNNASDGGHGVLGVAQGSGIGVRGINTASNGFAGYFDGRLFSTVAATSSDARLKTDIKPVGYGLEQLLKLKPVAFKWKAHEQDGVQLGLIAQEVQAVVPEVVTHDANGMLAMNYSALLPVAIKAIQQQEQVIAAQNERIARLERAAALLRSSMFPSEFSGAFALGLLPLALLARLRKRSQSRAAGRDRS